MSVLDQRIADGLRDLVNRAPIGADIWPETERYVTKHQQSRCLTARAVGLAEIRRWRGTRRRT